THLLIDEFQDTDPVQAEMMFLLTGENDTNHDWRHTVPRAGSLFVVGDPKQSIYRFRRADISIYNFVKKRIAQSGGAVLQLTQNFRSVKAIGNFVNYAFASMFAAPGSSGAPAGGPGAVSSTVANESSTSLSPLTADNGADSNVA